MGNILCFKNNVFRLAYVKDMTDSMQNPFSPHKTYDSHGSFYLNVSEHMLPICTTDSYFDYFYLKLNDLIDINGDKMLINLYFL